MRRGRVDAPINSRAHGVAICVVSDDFRCSYGAGFVHNLVDSRHLFSREAQPQRPHLAVCDVRANVARKEKEELCEGLMHRGG